MSGFRLTLIKNVIRNEYGEVRETMNDFISNLNKNVVGNEEGGPILILDQFLIRMY